MVGVNDACRQEPVLSNVKIFVMQQRHTQGWLHQKMIAIHITTDPSVINMDQPPLQKDEHASQSTIKIAQMDQLLTDVIQSFASSLFPQICILKVLSPTSTLS